MWIWIQGELLLSSLSFTAPNTRCSNIVRHLCCCSDGEHHAEAHTVFRHNQMIPYESHLRFMMCSNVRMNMLYVNIVIVKLYLSVDLFLSFKHFFVLLLFLFITAPKWQNTRKHAIVTSNKFTVKAIIQSFAFGSFVITLSASAKMSSSQSTNQQQLYICVCTL